MMKQNGLTMMSMMRNINRTTVITSITRCLLLLTILLWVSPVMAQKDPKATVAAMNILIKQFNDKKVTERFSDEIVSKFKDNPEVSFGIADAYWYWQKDSVRAYKYMRKTFAIDPNYQPAYELAGTIERHYNNDSLMLDWYNRGIKADPKTKNCYFALADYYAKKKMGDKVYPIFEALAQNDSTFDAHRYAASYLNDRVVGTDKQLYFEYAEEIMDHYSKVNLDSMTAYDYAQYQNFFFYNKRYAKALEICDNGVKRHPKSITLARNAMKAAFNLELNDSVLLYYDHICKNFNRVDSPQIKAEDVYYYAITLQRKNKFDKAIAAFQDMITMKDASDNFRSNAVQKIADCYKELGDYDMAEKTYLEYLEQRKADSVLTRRDLYLVANMYSSKAEESNGQDKIDAYNKADAIYAEAAEYFPDYAVDANYRRFLVALKKDPEDHKNERRARPFTEFIYNRLNNNCKDETDKDYLMTAARWLSFCCFFSDEYNLCYEYVTKWMEYDPDNGTALQIYGIVQSKAKRKRR
ncbi:MAG: hypothetical protein MR005_05830 [Prevotella sp.]|nr:hypothetical protein [Prevotella sp.]